MQTIIKALLLILIMVVDCMAAPGSISVSGTISGGQSVTISGTGFLTRSDYSTSSSFLNRAWNNFEGGTLLKDDWQHGYGGLYSDNWSVETAGGRTGSTYYADRVYEVIQTGALEIPQSFDAGVWYTSFYVQISDTCPTSGAQGKLMRIYGDNSENIYFSPYGSNNTILSFFESINGAEWGSPDGLGTNNWHRLEMLMDRATTTTRVYLDGKLQWTRTDWPSSGFAGGGHTWDIGNMVETVMNTCHHRFDDVYLDNTQARVEICDAATWSTSSARHCEVQIPTSWSDTSIGITVNQGSFAAEATAYLYVVDSTGAVNSSGIPIEIGASGSNITCYPDADTDLYPGSGSESVETCSSGYYESSHFTAMTADCNDASATINPGATETCGDSIDQDCSGADLACAAAVTLTGSTTGTIQ